MTTTDQIHTAIKEQARLLLELQESDRQLEQAQAEQTLAKRAYDNTSRYVRTLVNDLAREIAQENS